MSQDTLIEILEEKEARTISHYPIRSYARENIAVQILQKRQDENMNYFIKFSKASGWTLCKKFDLPKKKSML